jgi:radical SAM protein with 4Fe4S-binding SPASM domain
LREARDLGVQLVTLTGGEVFLRPDFCGVMERVDRAGCQAYILSNLTMLKSEHVDSMRHGRTKSISTSIDGPQDYHDRFRGKSGCFDATWKALERLRKADLTVKVSVTVTAENIKNIRSLFQRLDDLGIPSSIARVAPIGRGHLIQIGSDKFNDEYSILLAERLAQAIPGKQRETIGPSLNNASTYCGVGESMIYVRSDGEFTLCPTLTPEMDSRWSLGTFPETSLVEAREKLDALNEQFTCQEVHSCKFGNACRGGCRANAFIATGQLGFCDSEMFDGFSQMIRSVPPRSHRRHTYMVT